MKIIDYILRSLWNPGTWIGAVFYAAIFLVAAVIVARAVRLAAQRIMARRDSSRFVDPTVVMFLTQFAQIGVYIIALILLFHIIPALNKLGAALLTGVSVASVVFGLAAQNTLSNLVAGITLLLYRPFHIDDLIQVATPTGTEVGIVERLTLGYTMLRTPDDRLVVVPNSLMASQVSLNLNRGAVHSMIVAPVGVMKPAHVEAVRQALLEIARKHPKIHHVIGCVSKPFEDGGVILSLRAWCASPAAAEETKQDILNAVRDRFAREHIDLLVPALPPAKQAPQ